MICYVGFGFDLLVGFCWILLLLMLCFLFICVIGLFGCFKVVCFGACCWFRLFTGIAETCFWLGFLIVLLWCL